MKSKAKLPFIPFCSEYHDRDISVGGKKQAGRSVLRCGVLDCAG